MLCLHIKCLSSCRRFRQGKKFQKKPLWKGIKMKPDKHQILKSRRYQKAKGMLKRPDEAQSNEPEIEGGNSFRYPDSNDEDGDESVHQTRALQALIDNEAPSSAPFQFKQEDVKVPSLQSAFAVSAASVAEALTDLPLHVLVPGLEEEWCLDCPIVYPLVEFRKADDAKKGWTRPLPRPSASSPVTPVHSQPRNEVSEVKMLPARDEDEEWLDDLLS